MDLPLDAVRGGVAVSPPAAAHPRQARGAAACAARTLVVLQISAVGLVAVVCVWSACAKVIASDRLRVAAVEVRGSHFLSEGEVRELLGPAVGENILDLDIDALKARLRASPWVADAPVQRSAARHAARRDRASASRWRSPRSTGST